MNMTKLLTPALLAALFLTARALDATNTPEEAARAPVAGKVIETTNSGDYTYVLVQHGGHKTWAASRPFEVAVGDAITIPEGWVMKDFKSRSLNRTFAWILFAPAVEVSGKGAKLATSSLPPGHPTLTATNSVAPAAAPPVEIKPGSVEKVRGGYTVEECYAKKRELAGKSVKVRGVVVKFTPSVMGKNWIHIRDGSGKADTGDLTLTTMKEVKRGDTIVAEGKVVCDKDFGAGYKYSVLIESAIIKN